MEVFGSDCRCKTGEKSKNDNKNDTYLHDELNGTNEVREELEDKVLLLLLHLVETVLAATRLDLRLSETHARVGLKHVVGDRAATTGGGLLLLVIEVVAVLRLEVVDEGIDILILILIRVGNLGLLGSRGTLGGDVLLAVGALLVEAAGLDVGVERRSADTLLLVRHLAVDQGISRGEC